MSRVGRIAVSVAVVVAMVAPIGFVAGCDGAADVNCVVDDAMIVGATKKPKATKKVDDIDVECVEVSESASSSPTG